MSVSDVVVTENGAFFCDSSDFKSVGFDAAKTQKPINLMRIVYVEPGKPAYETEILYTLSSMQKAVCGGFIEQIMIENNCAYIGNSRKEKQNARRSIKIVSSGSAESKNRRNYSKSL